VNLERLWGMVTKEFRQLARDPDMLRIVFVGPVIQLLVFGYAVSTDLRKVPTMVVDHDRTQSTRALVQTIAASGYFEVVRMTDRPADLVRALEQGEAVVALEIPAGFTRELTGGGSASIQILLDGTNSNTAQVAKAYVERIIVDHVRRTTKGIPAAPMELEERAWYNPELASRTYNVPATIGTLNLVLSLMLTSLAVVREKEIGTLEQLRVSPLRASELILGKTIPFAVLGMVNLAIVTTVALLWFSIPLRGSVLLLIGASALYIVSGLALGLIVSTFSNTQQEAFMSTFMVVMPSILLSGFMFPVTSMPEPVQWLTMLNPVRHYIDVVRGIFLKGSGIELLWTKLAALAAIGAVMLAVAITRFRRSALG
jgi:ABC-2 type transport system permease protein